jgi:hypothetical protein
MYDQEIDKVWKLRELKRLMFMHPHGVSDLEVAALLKISRAYARVLRQHITGVREVSHGRFTCEPCAEEVEIAQAIIWRARRGS